jgi:hypothetical protein
VTVSLYYWAGAKAAAGVEGERFDAETVADALDQARRRTLTDPVRVEILPPFAGGSGVLSGPRPTVED